MASMDATSFAVKMISRDSRKGKILHSPCSLHLSAHGDLSKVHDARSNHSRASAKPSLGVDPISRSVAGWPVALLCSPGGDMPR